jgi:hypothetical protein
MEHHRSQWFRFPVEGKQGILLGIKSVILSPTPNVTGAVWRSKSTVSFLCACYDCPPRQAPQWWQSPRPFTEGLLQACTICVPLTLTTTHQENIIKCVQNSTTSPSPPLPPWPRTPSSLTWILEASPWSFCSYPSFPSINYTQCQGDPLNLQTATLFYSIPHSFPFYSK